MLQLTTLFLFKVKKQRAKVKFIQLKKKHYGLWGLTFFNIYLYYFFFDMFNHKLLLNFCPFNFLNSFFIKKPLIGVLNKTFNYQLNHRSYFVLASNNLERFIYLILYFYKHYFLLMYFGYFFDMCLSVNNLYYLDCCLLLVKYNIRLLYFEFYNFLWFQVQKFLFLIISILILLYQRVAFFLEIKS